MIQVGCHQRELQRLDDVVEAAKVAAMIRIRETYNRIDTLRSLLKNNFSILRKAVPKIPGI